MSGIEPNWKCPESHGSHKKRCPHKRAQKATLPLPTHSNILYTISEGSRAPWGPAIHSPQLRNLEFDSGDLELVSLTFWEKYRASPKSLPLASHHQSSQESHTALSSHRGHMPWERQHLPASGTGRDVNAQSGRKGVAVDLVGAGGGGGTVCRWTDQDSSPGSANDSLCN